MNPMNKSKEKLLDLFISVFSIIVILSFGIIIYKNSENTKASNYLNKIEQLLQNENYQETKLYATKILKKTKNEQIRIILYSKLGDANLFLKNYPEAMQAYMNSYELRPDDPQVCANIGFILGEMKKYEEGIKYLYKAKKINPEIPQIHNNLGVQFANQGKNTKAIASFKKAIEVNPKFYRAYANLSSIYFSLKDRLNTKRYISLAIENGAKDDPAFKELFRHQLIELDKLKTQLQE